MSVVLHLSDTHFGTERSEVCIALLKLAREVRPDVAILSGDVTQRARRGEFSAACEFLDSLATPVKLVIAGNHDIPLFNIFARLLNPYGNFRRAFGLNLEPQFSDKDFLIIGVNTTRPLRHKDGEVSAHQIERVSHQLQLARPHQLRIVVVHQPVFVERESDLVNLLYGHTHAIEAWTNAGADLILSGHIHLAYVHILGGQMQNLKRSIWTVSAGTAISKRVRKKEPNSVNIIRYESEKIPRSCIVEQLNFNKSSSRFILAKSTLLELS